MKLNIIDSISDLSKYKTFTERYFCKRYILNVDGVKNNDIMIMFHSNRIALLSLAPSHFFFTKNGGYNVNFTIGKVDRLNNVVKGKGKKGGQWLTPSSVICKVQLTDGTGFDVPCCMKATLIEVNEELVKHPGILKELPDSYGFIAIILSSIAVCEAAKSVFLTHDEYIKILNENYDFISI